MADELSWQGGHETQWKRYGVEHGSVTLEATAYPVTVDLTFTNCTAIHDDELGEPVTSPLEMFFPAPMRLIPTSVATFGIEALDMRDARYKNHCSGFHWNSPGSRPTTSGQLPTWLCGHSTPARLITQAKSSR